MNYTNQPTTWNADAKPLTLADIANTYREVRAKSLEIVVSEHVPIGAAYLMAGDSMMGIPRLCCMHPDDYKAHPELADVPIYEPERDLFDVRLPTP